MTEPVTCDIFVLSLDTPELTRACLESVVKHTALAGRLILVNNGAGSRVQSVFEALQTPNRLEKIILSFPKNRGFVDGNNEAYKHSRSRFICLLNSDTQVTAGWLEEMIDVAKSESRIGLVNPSHHGSAPVPQGLSVDAWAALRHTQFHLKYCEIQKASGYCLLAKREAVEACGGLLDPAIDKAFFEDEDLSMRARQHGWKMVQALGAYVHHLEHASFHQLDFDPEEIFQKNKRWFENKWGRALRVLAALSYPSRDRIENHETFRFAIEPLTETSNHVTIFTNHTGLMKTKKKLGPLFPEIGSSRTAVQSPLAWRLKTVFHILKKRKKPYDVFLTNDACVLKMLEWFQHYLGVRLFQIDEKNKVVISKMPNGEMHSFTTEELKELRKVVTSCVSLTS